MRLWNAICEASAVRQKGIDEASGSMYLIINVDNQ